MASKTTVEAGRNVYRGYMPIDLPQHRKRNPIKPWWKVIGKPRVTIYPKEEVTGYSDVAQYPEINHDGTPEACRKQIRTDWYKQIKSLPTEEEKSYEIARHNRHYMAMINNWLEGYGTLPMIQYITQTHIINSLPDYYNQVETSSDEGEKSNEGINDTLDTIRKVVLNQIALDKFNSIKTNPNFVSSPARDRNRHGYVSSSFIGNMFSNIKKSVSPMVNREMIDYQIDWRPAIRTWIYHSGLEAPDNRVYYRSRKDENDKINQMIQIDGSSAINLRASNFIEPYLNVNDPIVTDLSLVPECVQSPRFHGTRYVFKSPVSLPGFWKNNEDQDFEFPHTCFLTTDCLKTKRYNKPYPEIMDHKEQTLNGQAILTAYSWLSGLSMYHGFTPFHNTLYPFTCQTITTDGQDWLFNVYQMNNNVFHRDVGGVKLNNVLWSSGLMQLYSDYSDGTFKDVNENVFNILLRFISKQTNASYTKSLDLRPYLGEDLRSEETRVSQRKQLRNCIEQRYDKYVSSRWRVPLYEHLFFRSKEGRQRITHMKPRFHPTKPKMSKVFQ